MSRPVARYRFSRRYLLLAIAALVCKRCGARGTLIANYGPEATEEDVEVLLGLQGLEPEDENPV